MAVYTATQIGIKPPAGGFQNGGWYNGRQYWNGTFSEPGVIHPSSPQQGAGQAVSKEVVAQTNPNNVKYIEQQKKQPIQPTATTTTAPTPGLSSAEQAYNDIVNEVSKGIDPLVNKEEEFVKNNPFSFDEILARAASEETYNPYYDAQLSDFIGGIKRQLESTEGERGLLSELNQMASVKERRNLEEAIRASEEGYAGSGLFFSGARERSTGLNEIEAKDIQTEREKRYGFNVGEIGRRIEDIGATRRTGERQIGAERTTAITTDIEKQKAEERARWEYEKNQFIGSPYVNQGSLNELLNYA